MWIIINSNPMVGIHLFHAILLNISQKNYFIYVMCQFPLGTPCEFVILTIQSTSNDNTRDVHSCANKKLFF